MKKQIALLLATAMLLGLTACGGGSTVTENSSSGNTTSENSAEMSSGSTTSENSAEMSSEEASSADVSPTETETEAVTLDETVVYDEGGITVTVMGLEHNDSEGYWAIPVTVSNATDQDISTDMGNTILAVNGLITDFDTAGFSACPAAGESEEMEIQIEDSALAKQGIDTIAEVEFPLAIFSAADDMNAMAEPNIAFTTSAGADYVQPAVDGEVLYEGDGVRLISLGWKDDETWDNEFVVYAENTSDAWIDIDIRVTAVNGNKSSDGHSTSIYERTLFAGKGCFGSLYLSGLDDFGVTSQDEIQTIEVYFSIDTLNAGGYWDAVETDAITLTLA